MTRYGFLWALLCPMFAGTLGAQPTLAFDQSTQTVVASGLDASLSDARLAVYFEDSQIPILGDNTVESGGLRFTPRFPFMPGRTHHAVLSLPGRPVLRLSFHIDAPALSPKTRVTQVFPSADVVPANLLRIYVHFSHPMTRRGIARYVRLMDLNGQPVQSAFLEMDDGLWDPDGRRLTLFLHPGRIKRGLALHDDLGSPLRPGVRYRLVIAKEAEDEDGVAVIEGFSKEFRVGAEDRTTPNFGLARVPAAGSREPLIVRADEALDAALFARMLRVADAADEPVGGDSSVEAQETSWRFVPAAPWKSGVYTVRIGAELEDLAGNRPTRLFDEVAAPDGRRVVARELRLMFVVAGVQRD